MIENKLYDLLEQEKQLTEKMNSGTVTGDEFSRLTKEMAKIGKITPIIREYFATKQGIEDAEAMLAEPDLKELANEQLMKFKQLLPEVEQKLQLALLPKDDADDKSAIVEIRAGVGGDEAALFAGDLYNQYLNYAARRGWKTETIDESPISLHGYKEVVLRNNYIHDNQVDRSQIFEVNLRGNANEIFIF